MQDAKTENETMRKKREEEEKRKRHMEEVCVCLEVHVANHHRHLVNHLSVLCCVYSVLCLPCVNTHCACLLPVL